MGKLNSKNFVNWKVWIISVKNKKSFKINDEESVLKIHLMIDCCLKQFLTINKVFNCNLENTLKKHQNTVTIGSSLVTFQTKTDINSSTVDKNSFRV